MIETKQGIAEDIRSSVDISGGNYGIFVNTAHITLFSIDGFPVKIITKTPPIIQEGNEVIVSGEVKNGQLTAYAYRNITTDSNGDRGYLKRFLGGLFLLLLWFYFWFILSRSAGEIAKLASIPFLGFSLYYLYTGNKILKAIKHLKQHPNNNLL